MGNSPSGPSPSRPRRVSFHAHLKKLLNHRGPAGSKPTGTNGLLLKGKFGLDIKGKEGKGVDFLVSKSRILSPISRPTQGLRRTCHSKNFPTKKKKTAGNIYYYKKPQQMSKFLYSEESNFCVIYSPIPSHLKTISHTCHMQTSSKRIPKR
ncbi:hypothetical protein PYW08_003035 [Mythimna loreyi]|uniref:Uncharacterized protein n=1 Tax=Mythimna loreyi TaxID=667449 RepID=A0ACC2QQM2_9NEOP|nr:hypothetical protein PYW08_003035 [Mythimna loreyi]